MLLAIDIGNTDFTIGIFQEKKLCDTFRMRTKINRTSDEYGVFILNTLQYKGYEAKDVEDDKSECRVTFRWSQLGVLGTSG